MKQGSFSGFRLLSEITGLHVTLANPQTFGFEFHMRPLPLQYTIGQLAGCFTFCYCTVLTRPNQVETAVHGCSSLLYVWSLWYRSPVKLSA